MRNTPLDHFICPQCSHTVTLSFDAPCVCDECGSVFPWEGGVLSVGQEEDRDDYPDAVYDLLARVEPRHFWFTERTVRILDALRHGLGSIQGRTLLDVGCGTGFVLSAAERAGMVACGIDIHGLGLSIARQRMRGLLIRGNAKGLPFDSQFDSVLLADVIEHTDDDVSVVREVAHALMPDGVMVITVPALPQLWTVVDEYSGHKRRYERDQLAGVIEAAGLRLGSVEYYNILLTPMQLLQRRLAGVRFARTPADQMAVLNRALTPPPFPLNTALGWVSRMDSVFKFVPAMVGSSLIAIAYR